jgi:3-hydroxyacyl-CoA dehydrogenase
MKKIGVIGSGVVKQTLAKGFIKHRYDVMIRRVYTGFQAK